MTDSSAAVAPSASRRWSWRLTGFPWPTIGRRLTFGNESGSVIPEVPLVATTTESEGELAQTGQITMTFGGNSWPSRHPKAVRPNRDQLGPIGAPSPEEADVVLTGCLVDVLQGTAAVLSGGNPDSLIRPFVLPGSEKTANLLTGVLARKLIDWERRPEVIIGHGTIGGIFASNVTQGMLEGRFPVAFLPIERNVRAMAEGFNFLCAESEIRTFLQGKRILLAVPILSERHCAEILEVRRLIDAEDCAAQVVGIVTIIQYGDLPPSMGDLKVQSLLTISR